MRFSSLDQLFACPGYTSIQTDKAKEEAQYPNIIASREWGTMVHTWKETGKISHPSGDKREEKLFANRIYKSEKNKREKKIEATDYWPTGGFHEIQVAYNWKEQFSEISFTKDDKWYSYFDDDYILGTIDYVLEDNGALRVSDLKTGKWWTKLPTESMQIMGYGLATFASMAWPIYTQMDLEVVHWPKYPAKSPPKVIKETIYTADLVAFGKKVEEKMNQRGEVFNPSEDNCRFCPGRFDCMFAVKKEEEYGTP